MLAMREGDFLMFMSFVFTFVIVVIVLAQRLKLRLERQKTIQMALESQALDDASRQRMIELLARDDDWLRAAGRNLVPAVRTVIFVGGWLTMIIGGGIALMSFTDGQLASERFEAVVATLVGFALVTLPLAMRELRARTAV